MTILATDPSLKSPILPPLALEEETQPVDESVVEKVQEVANGVFCNPAQGAIDAVLAFEDATIKKLHAKEMEANDLLATTNLLLDLSKELAAISASDKVQLSNDMQSILSSLKEKGIDLLAKDAQEISKEQLIELKSAIGAHIDKSRTQIQQIFTKMQTLIQFMTSVNDSGKRIISDFTQMIRTILKNTVH